MYCFRSPVLGLILGVLAVGFLAHPTSARENPPNVDKINKTIDNFTLVDVRGKQVSLDDFKDKKAIVVVFLSFECPVSNSYASVLAKLAGKYDAARVAFLGINPSDDLTPEQLAKKTREFKIPFPVVKDRDFLAADTFKTNTVPEAFVLDHNRVLRYRGRIDNSYYARLRRNIRTTQHDLKQALDELLAGKEISTPATHPVGCPIIRDRKVKKTGKVTYYRDVLPILQDNCQACHRPGEVGPFSLMTYKQALKWGQDIKYYTQTREMPPWKPVEGAKFHNERKLTDKEIKTLAAWVDEGMPQGDATEAPSAAKFTTGWQLGKPDLILTVPSEMTVGASGKDVFRCFVLPTGLKEDKYVVGVEVRPGNNRVVHHTLNFWDLTGKARQLQTRAQEKASKGKKGQDYGPGYSVSMGIGFLPQRGKFGGLGGWAPGQRARQLPKGTGYLLPRGSDLVLQVHYHRTGRVEKDRTTIGLYFSKKPVTKQFRGMVIPGRFLFIPANKENHRVTGEIEVLQDCTLHSVMPHMHMLGKSIKVTLTQPGEKPQTLLTIKDWDYNWQETYFLAKSIPLKAGAKMQVEAIYDNSSKNPNNPFSPPRLVFFGEQTTNEMCFVFLGATADKPGRIKFRAKGWGGRRFGRRER